MDMNILQVPNEFDESPIKVKINNLDQELESGKWYYLNIVKFKYIHSLKGKTNNITKYKFVIINQLGNEVNKWLRIHQINNFDHYLLDGRRDVRGHNKVFGENVLQSANKYSKNLTNKEIEDLMFQDYEKDLMLERTNESEDSLNENTILNIK